MVIDDAAQDYRFAPSGVPLAATTYCRSYAAAPIFAPNGAVLGTLAVCSPEPNMFTREHGRTLEVLARQIITRLELYTKTNQQDRVVRSRQRIERALTVSATSSPPCSIPFTRSCSCSTPQGASCASIAPARPSAASALPNWSAARFRKSSSLPRSAITPCACSSRRAPESSTAVTKSLAHPRRRNAPHRLDRQLAQRSPGRHQLRHRHRHRCHRTAAGARSPARE